MQGFRHTARNGRNGVAVTTDRHRITNGVFKAGALFLAQKMASATARTEAMPSGWLWVMAVAASAQLIASSSLVAKKPTGLMRMAVPLPQLP